MTSECAARGRPEHEESPLPMEPWIVDADAWFIYGSARHGERKGSALWGSQIETLTSERERCDPWEAAEGWDHQHSKWGRRASELEESAGAA